MALRWAHPSGVRVGAPGRRWDRDLLMLGFVSIDDLDAAFQAAEAELRAYYTEVRERHRTMAAADPDYEHVPETGWTETERETLEDLRARSVEAAMALLEARDWSGQPGCDE